MSFGAVGDGRADDGPAIARALAALRPGQALSFAGGTVFCHSTVLSVTTSGAHLVGPATLQATDEQQSAIKIEADNVTVSNLTLAVASTTRRWSTPSQHKLVLGGFPGGVVSDVKVTGSAAAGIFCLGASQFVLQNVTVADTRADGIHMTNGSHDGSVTSAMVLRSGDDGVAVVSYLDDAQPCRNIAISRPTVRTTTGGRGISVVGGHDISYTDITVSDSFAASVYIACEGGSSVTRPTRAVRITGGTISGANTDAAIDHGAVLVYSGRNGGDVSDVVVSGLSIADTRSSASRQIGVVVDRQDTVSGITFSGLRLAAQPTPYQGDAPVGAFSLSDVTAGGQLVRAS